MDSSYFQKLAIIRNLHQIFNKCGGALVEMFLNYDCDTEEENICEKLLDSLVKLIINSRVEAPEHIPNFLSQIPSKNFDHTKFPIITTSTVANFTKEQYKQLFLSSGDMNELKKQTMNLLVNGILNGLHKWIKESIEKGISVKNNDDPIIFENAKHKKHQISEGFKMFSNNQKKGISYLIESGIIEKECPETISTFFFNNYEFLDKEALGNYLGDGCQNQINVMNAFIDLFDFRMKTFVEALRFFLSTFRLPGESQKIDRLMCKFSEKYVKDNPNCFNTTGNQLINQRNRIRFIVFNNYVEYRSA